MQLPAVLIVASFLIAVGAGEYILRVSALPYAGEIEYAYWHSARVNFFIYLFIYNIHVISNTRQH